MGIRCIVTLPWVSLFQKLHSRVYGEFRVLRNFYQECVYYLRGKEMGCDKSGRGWRECVGGL